MTVPPAMLAAWLESFCCGTEAVMVGCSF